jgi:hypothetical protein
MVSYLNLVVIVGSGLTGNASKAREPCLGGANDPNRRTTLTPNPSPMCVDGILKPLDQVCACDAGIRTQVQLDVLVKSYRCETVLHCCLSDHFSL